MKITGLLFFIFLFTASFAQRRFADDAAIDWQVGTIDADRPDTLAYRLTAGYATEREKVRAIFRWITEHIAYRTRHNSKHLLYDIEEPELDTANNATAANEMAARRVLRRRIAVCDGYARLFKNLCDHAGVPAEIVSGYARSDRSRIGTRFATNHSWNAVYLDSAWHLLDATWASGYITYSGGDFVKNYNDDYFLTPPRRFIEDHFPEDPKWTLLPEVPVVREFYRTPFKSGAFVKYRISEFLPARGLIEAAVGDTIYFELKTVDAKKLNILLDGAGDTTSLPAFAVYNLNNNKDEKRIRYAYKIPDGGSGWLNVVYNDEVIMRYRLTIKNNKGDTAFASTNNSE